MALPRRLHVLLFGCVVCVTVVCTSAASTLAQSHSKSPARSRTNTTSPKPAERADVEHFRQRADAALAASGADKALWGVLVSDAATGEVFYSRNADNYFSPASNAKLFTTAFALATLGPDYRVRTNISGLGTIDASGVLQGDLLLVGRGDANLSNRKFPYGKREEREGSPDKILAEFADAVVVRGIREVTGDVIADDSVFKHESFPSGWTVDDILWSYGAAVSAVAVNDNVFALILRPGERDGDAARTESIPSADFYSVENSVRTGIRGSEQKLAVARDPGSRLIRVSGTMPVDAQPRRLSIAIEEPAEYAAALLARLLTARGVKIDGRTSARHAQDASLSAIGSASGSATTKPETVFAEHVSVPLGDDVRLTNKNSENLHAELMLLTAAREKSSGESAPTSYEDALKLESIFFKTAGIADGDVALNDGSGLSRKDLVTPRAVVQMLRYAATQPWGELYRSSLPVAGEDGTLSERMKNTPAAGRVFAKTGTIGHANAVSGYATTVRGNHVLFSILGNNNDLRAPDAGRVIDAIILAMVEELGTKSQSK